MTNHIDQSLLVLWDIDGTLLATGDLSGADDYAVAIRWFVPELSVTSVNAHGKTDRQVVEELLVANALGLDLAPFVMERLDTMGANFFVAGRQIPVLAGANESMRRMLELGYANGLLTGNTPGRALGKLRASGIDTTLVDWHGSFFGTNAADRPDITRAARTKFPGRPMVIVGDTPRDGHAAAAAGIPFIGVETGVYDAQALREAGATTVVPDLVSGAGGLEAALAGVAA